jgi:hypothetical protein
MVAAAGLGSAGIVAAVFSALGRAMESPARLA